MNDSRASHKFHPIWGSFSGLSEYSLGEPWAIEALSDEFDLSRDQEGNIRVLLARRTLRRPAWAYASDLPQFVQRLQNHLTGGNDEIPRIYLDTCHWTHLSDIDAGCGERLKGVKDIYEKIYSHVVRLTAEKKAVFPLSLPLILEIYGQSKDPLRRRRAAFMERISRNIAVLLADNVERWETSSHNIDTPEYRRPPLTTIGWQALGAPVLHWLSNNVQRGMNLRWPTVMTLVWNTWSASLAELSDAEGSKKVRVAKLEAKAAVEDYYADKNCGTGASLMEQMMNEFKKEVPNLYDALSRNPQMIHKLPALTFHALLRAATYSLKKYPLAVNDTVDACHLHAGIGSCEIVFCDKKYFKKLEQSGILPRIPQSRRITADPREMLALLGRIP